MSKIMIDIKKAPRKSREIGGRGSGKGEVPRERSGLRTYIWPENEENTKMVCIPPNQDISCSHLPTRGTRGLSFIVSSVHIVWASGTDTLFR